MAAARQRSARNQLRIIGGEWRGRRLHFPDAPGLRPTGDRIRETLFNWLAADIREARCLDLFAGSGSLGLEALSRGAAHCDFVDAHAPAAVAIGDHLATLDAISRGSVHRQDARAFLASCRQTYDLVFLDPPFNDGVLEPLCAAIAESGVLARGATIYLEHDVTQTPTIPTGWSERRSKRAGQVGYALWAAGED